MSDHPLSADCASSCDGPSRRELFAALAAAGVGTPVFQRALAAQAEKTGRITPEVIEQAEWISGLKLSEADRKSVARTVSRWQGGQRKLRGVKLANSVPFPLVFTPAAAPHTAAPHTAAPPADRAGSIDVSDKEAPKKPASDEDLAFLPVSKLAGLLRSRKVSSVELTKLYLARLKEYDPVLSCVVTLTEETALKQAQKADEEIGKGNYRGALHGIPWGAKDLIAYPGYPTTWGAEAYREQKLDTKATVAKKLEEAGAVLVAKLSLGALAMGDHWYGDRVTKNPWNPTQGSSGSSAGSASATAAGLAGFTLGSETLGSIVSPCRVCGTSGLRPTFGRVSRYGCMTLCWSMDKIGPIARSLEDCALVFGAIHGRDDLDASTVDRPFSWPARRALKDLKVGYFEGRTPEKTQKVLKELGVKLVPIQLPSKYLFNELIVILNAESAAAFDELTRNGGPIPATWRNTFQSGPFISATDYIRANRIRALLMQEMEETMRKVDLYVGGNDLLLTNMTGHPEIVLPNGLVKRNEVEVPTSITFTGRLYGEADLLALGHAYQKETGYHLKRPAMEKLKKG
jgi:Asp-tRNA(Asn)/Glu-tRNA(Gln) amidotransferase A subunit family amidase